MGGEFPEFASNWVLGNLLLLSMKLRVVLITLLLLAPLTPSISDTPPKAGAICSKAGIAKNYNGKKYTCVKNGKKLVWNKGVIIKVAAPKPAPTPIPSPSHSVSQSSKPSLTPNTQPSSGSSPASSPSSNALPSYGDFYANPSRSSQSWDKCKITETSSQRLAFSKYSLKSISGFPMTYSRIPEKGSINFLAIPVDWADAPGDEKLLREVKNQLDLHSEWWNVVSEGNLKINSTLFDRWIRLPGESKSYAVPFSEAYPETGEFWNKAIKVIDPVIDFTDVQVVTFIFPTGQKVIPASVQELFPIGSIKDYPPQEGKLIAFIGPGSMFYQWNTTPWSYWAHEMGHLLDFAHGGSPNGSQDMGGYDMMFSQDGPSRTLSGWWRFLADWTSSNQVFCEDKLSDFPELEVSLVPIDSSEKGIKLVILKVSDSKVLIIEARRFTKFHNSNRTGNFQQVRLSSEWDGVFVYTYDGNRGHLEDFFTPVASNTALSEYNWDGQTRYISKRGEEIYFEGLKIQVLGSGKYDAIRISKLSNEELTKPRPTPSPAPSPKTTDFNVAPTPSGGGVRTGETTGLSTWYGQNYRSYRIYVVPASEPNSKPMFDTGIINDYSSPVRVNLSNLTCKRDELEVAIFYSGLDGKGLSTRIEQSHLLSKVTIDPRTGKCTGNWTITPRG